MDEPRPLAIANLDFEYELAAGISYQAPGVVEKLCHRWRYLLRLLPGFEGACCAETAGSASRLAVWGVTPRVLKMAEAAGLAASLPGLEAVRKVNDKRFSHGLEQQLGVALPHTGVIASGQELDRAVRDCPYDWVLKHPFGVSGRERMLGKRGQISASARGWAERRFRQGWGLLFEPWVEQREEFSLHFQLSPSGEVEYVGACELITDAGGVYRGNRVLDRGFVDPLAVDLGGRAARVVADEGYWGPLGIDAFRGRLGPEPVLRPIVELNARYTFGRMTLALGRWLPAGWCYSWCHPKRAPRGTYQPLPADRPGLYALPRPVDPDGVSGTVVVLAPTALELAQLESASADAFASHPPSCSE